MKNIILILAPIFLFSQQESNLYKAVPTETIASFQFKKSSYYDYCINAQNAIDSIYTKVIQGNYPEALLSQQYSLFFNKNSKEQKNEIILLSRITVNYNSQEFYVIKYAIRENDKVISYNTYSLYKKEENWVKFDANNSILNSIKVVLGLKNYAFAQFETQDNNTAFPEINKFKLLSKDGDGTLNIYLLAKIIEDNESELSKYLD